MAENIYIDKFFRSLLAVIRYAQRDR